MSPPHNIHNLISRIIPSPSFSLSVQLSDVRHQRRPVGFVQRWIGEIHVIGPREIVIRFLVRPGCDPTHIGAEVSLTTTTITAGR